MKRILTTLLVVLMLLTLFTSCDPNSMMYKKHNLMLSFKNENCLDIAHIDLTVNGHNYRLVDDYNITIRDLPTGDAHIYYNVYDSYGNLIDKSGSYYEPYDSYYISEQGKEQRHTITLYPDSVEVKVLYNSTDYDNAATKMTAQDTKTGEIIEWTKKEAGLGSYGINLNCGKNYDLTIYYKEDGDRESSYTIPILIESNPMLRSARGFTLITSSRRTSFTVKSDLYPEAAHASLQIFYGPSYNITVNTDNIKNGVTINNASSGICRIVCRFTDEHGIKIGETEKTITLSKSKKNEILLNEETKKSDYGVLAVEIQDCYESDNNGVTIYDNNGKLVDLVSLAYSSRSKTGTMRLEPGSYKAEYAYGTVENNNTVTQYFNIEKNKTTLMTIDKYNRINAKSPDGNRTVVSLPQMREVKAYLIPDFFTLTPEILNPKAGATGKWIINGTVDNEKSHMQNNTYVIDREDLKHGFNTLTYVYTVGDEEYSATAAINYVKATWSVDSVNLPEEIIYGNTYDLDIAFHEEAIDRTRVIPTINFHEISYSNLHDFRVDSESDLKNYLLNMITDCTITVRLSGYVDKPEEAIPFFTSDPIPFRFEWPTFDDYYTVRRKDANRRNEISISFKDDSNYATQSMIEGYRIVSVDDQDNTFEVGTYEPSSTYYNYSICLPIDKLPDGKNKIKVSGYDKDGLTLFEQSFNLTINK